MNNAKENEANIWKWKPPGRASLLRQKSTFDTDVTNLPLEEAAAIVWERLHRKTTPRGVVGGGSDPLEVFRGFDRTGCGRLSPGDVAGALARIGLKASVGFVLSVVRREDAPEAENQAAAQQVDYADFVNALEARKPLPFGLVRSLLSGLVLQLGGDWGGGDESARSVYLMPEAATSATATASGGSPPDNQQWRLTSDGFLECKDRQASTAVASLLQGEEEAQLAARGEQDDSGDEGFGCSLDDSPRPKRTKRHSVVALAAPTDRGALQPLVLGLEGLVAGKKNAAGGKDFVSASRRRPAGHGARRAQRWQRNEATGELFSLGNGLYLTVKSGVKTMDAKLWVNKCKGSNAQKWAFEADSNEGGPGGGGGGTEGNQGAAVDLDEDEDWGQSQSNEKAHNPLMGSCF
mmetsp:Transcript_12900/g.25450  ORF Transcript_12900/g.25450 Transcript_12900/m.25450 type:complete len:406 (-) Transcript_12900:211-1428(-)